MRKVQLDEIMPLGAYDAVRDTFRNRMIAHKKARRLFVGPEMTFVFEDHDSVLLQVQEMLRAERISDPTAVRHEVDTYNELVPPDGALLATLMIEVPDPDTRERRRREYLGLDSAVSLAVGPHTVRARFAPEGLYEDRIAVVQYLRFDLPSDGRALLLDPNAKVTLRVEHARYSYATELSDATRRSLANDLDPANAQSRS